jgi:response regulator RpfG family c-di-GMP phosphodiesterase
MTVTASARTEAHKKKVLVVDDEMDMRIFLSTLLQTAGYQPFSASNGASAMKLVLEIRPDLIILEVMTAKDEGLNFFCSLKEDRHTRCIPVVILSTIDRKTFSFYQKIRHLMSTERDAGPEAFLEKPPEADELIDLVHELTSGRTSGPMGAQ